MWWPESIEELRAAYAAGDLIESQSLEFKRELPGQRRSVDLAIDICAMSPEGGVVIYGVSDDDGRADELRPFLLTDQRDRVYRIVRSGVSEAPDLVVHELVDDETERADGGRCGFLVVVVPASARAPHMVTVRGESRYYGRNGTENVPLGEGEVARLYGRRERVAVDLNERLDAVIAESSMAHYGVFARLYFYAAPALSDDGLLERARAAVATVGRERFPAILSEHLARAQAAAPSRGYAPKTDHLGGWVSTAGGYCVSTAADHGPDLSTTDADEALKIEVHLDGTVVIECGRAAYGDPSTGGRLYVFEQLIAGLVVQGLAFAGALYDSARYVGAVDSGVAVAGIKHAVSLERFGPGVHSLRGATPYNRDEYRRTHRGSAIGLADDPRAPAAVLVNPLLRALIGDGHEEVVDRFRP